MMMQHKRGDFSGEPIVIRDYADFKQDKAIAESRLKIRQVDMASRRITADYPELAAWLCLRVTARREFAVEKALQAEKVEAVVPARMGEKLCKRHRILPAPRLPVLPGYLLVRCVPSPAAVLGLLRFEGVRDIVGGGDRPYRVPLRFVSKFIDMAAAGGYDHRDPEPVAYQVGEHIRVIDGPFASFPGEVVSWAEGKQRIEISIDIFGRPTFVEMDIAQVEKL